jgi:uncharacterized protein YdaU (DUF1376 family)
MSKELPYFPFYTDDFLLDEKVEAMTHEQIGCYVVLLCRSWRSSTPGYIPSEPDKQARLIHIDASRWEQIKTGVLDCFKTDDDGRLYQSRLLEEYTKAKTAYDARVRGGKARAADMHKTPKIKGPSRSPIGLLKDSYRTATRSPVGNRTEENRTEEIREYIAPAIADAEAESPLFSQSGSSGPDTLPDQTPGLSEHVDRQKTKATDKPPRKPNPTWDAVCEIWQMKPVTAGDKKRVGKLAADYSAKGATLEEIRTRLDRYRRTWPNAASTPDALLKHWDAFANEPERKQDSNISRVHNNRGPVVPRIFIKIGDADEAQTGTDRQPEPGVGEDRAEPKKYAF